MWADHYRVGQIVDEEYYTIHVVGNNICHPLVDFSLDDIDIIIKEYKHIPKVVEILSVIKHKSRDMPLSVALKTVSLRKMEFAA